LVDFLLCGVHQIRALPTVDLVHQIFCGRDERLCDTL
jgi:hypothetical protein